MDRPFTTPRTALAMQRLKDEGISQDFILYSAHADVPEVLNSKIRRLYKDFGLIERTHNFDLDGIQDDPYKNMTELGREFFTQARAYVKAEEARTGVKHIGFPQVVCMLD